MSDEEYPDDSEQSLYDEEAREDSLDNDEISAEEEAFMKGYDDAEGDKKKQRDDSEDED